MVKQQPNLLTFTVEDLITFLKAHMRYPNEPFHLCKCVVITYLILALPRTNVVLTNYKASLSEDLSFSSRMLLLFSWQTGASEDAMKNFVLSDETLKAGLELSSQVEILAVETTPTEATVAREGIAVPKSKNNTSGSGGKKIPSWLKLKK
jgi:hypothetical protein